MLDSVLLALFLPCLGMSAVFIVYMCLLWYATTHQPHSRSSPAKPVPDKGLSASDLDKLPRIAGKDLVMGSECAVCLDEIENEQPARLVPGCNHGFHVECADTWLSKHPLCPVCRTKLDPQIFTPSSDQNPCWSFISVPNSVASVLSCHQKNKIKETTEEKIKKQTQRSQQRCFLIIYSLLLCWILTLVELLIFVT